MSTSHHGKAPENDPALMKQFLDQMEGRIRARQYPEGRITADDEGQAAFAIAADPKTNTIIIDFGKPVTWFGLKPDDANRLMNLLRQKINELGQAATITVGK